MNLLIMTYEPAPGTSLYPERSACGSPDQSAVSDLPIYITGYLTHEGPRHETGVAAAAAGGRRRSAARPRVPGGAVSGGVRARERAATRAHIKSFSSCALGLAADSHRSAHAQPAHPRYTRGQSYCEKGRRGYAPLAAGRRPEQGRPDRRRGALKATLVKFLQRFRTRTWPMGGVAGAG